MQALQSELDIRGSTKQSRKNGYIQLLQTRDKKQQTDMKYFYETLYSTSGNLIPSQRSYESLQTIPQLLPVELERAIKNMKKNKAPGEGGLTMDLWDLLDSDDDEEIVEFLNRPTIARQLFTRTELFDSLDEIKFVRRFRLTKGTTAILLQQIETHLRYRIDRVAAITPVNQLLCALRFYATGSQLITCGDMIGVHESTACRIVHRVTNAIA
ncbi:Uncharacterized protein OBRU01_18464, partial [Operophtera brumata]